MTDRSDWESLTAQLVALIRELLAESAVNEQVDTILASFITKLLECLRCLVRQDHN